MRAGQFLALGEALQTEGGGGEGEAQAQYNGTVEGLAEHEHGGHANQKSGMKLFRQPVATGQLVGVYSGDKLEGVVSHPGEKFHVHYIDNDLKVSGHVDQYNIKANSVLLLPK